MPGAPPLTCSLTGDGRYPLAAFGGDQLLSAMRQRPEDPNDADVAKTASQAARPAAAPIVYQPGRPSKTKRKQHAHQLQDLGEALVELPAGRLAATPMPETLRDAIAEYHRTRSFEGKRRQLQLIGKRMRFADETPLREAVDAFKLGSAKDTLVLHEVERWRDELVTDDEAMTRWAHTYPKSDLQQLRSLLRAARKDAAAAPEQRNGRGYRELFQFIKPWLKQEINPGPRVGSDGESAGHPDEDGPGDA
jgi:ribosome-associated protein